MPTAKGQLSVSLLPFAKCKAPLKIILGLILTRRRESRKHFPFLLIFVFERPHKESVMIASVARMLLDRTMLPIMVSHGRCPHGGGSERIILRLLLPLFVIGGIWTDSHRGRKRGEKSIREVDRRPPAPEAASVWASLWGRKGILAFFFSTILKFSKL